MKLLGPRLISKLHLAVVPYPLPRNGWRLRNALSYECERCGSTDESNIHVSAVSNLIWYWLYHNSACSHLDKWVTLAFWAFLLLYSVIISKIGIISVCCPTILFISFIQNRYSTSLLSLINQYSPMMENTVTSTVPSTKISLLLANWLVYDAFLALIVCWQQILELECHW